MRASRFWRASNPGAVSRGVEKASNFRWLRRLDFEKPAGAVRIGIDQPGLVHHRAVDLRDFAGNGRVNVAGGLDGLDHPAGLTPFASPPWDAHSYKDPAR